MAGNKLYNAFISYRHNDSVVVNKIYDWLQNVAGFNIWYDQNNLGIGQNITSQLPKEIEKCAAVMVIISESSVQSNWVEQEYNYAFNQQSIDKDFKIIPVRIDNTPVPGFLSNKKYLDIKNGELTSGDALLLIEALSNSGKSSRADSMLDVYLSRSWRSSDSLVADFITSELKTNETYRFIGDCEDQTSFTKVKGVNRVEMIIKSCGALMAILPDTGKGETSKYALDEINIALSFNIPVIIINDSATNYVSKANEDIIIVDKYELENKEFLTKLIRDISDILRENIKIVSNPLFVFWASNFDKNELIKTAKRLIEKVTAMQCVSGDEIRDEEVQNIIIKKINNALFMIADISGNILNTCIECGIALSSVTKLFIFSGDKRSAPKPFMLRNNQVFYYETESELIGRIYKHIRSYRRRVFNDE